MSYDYDRLYGETRDALGEPTSVFTGFFDRCENGNARVLDIGCGQGRDALFIARRGHRVVGVDLSSNGIHDLNAAAKRENLDVEGIVADITAYTPSGSFDVIAIDRTLHMLDPSDRRAVLAGLLGHVSAGGWVLIADEPSNMAEFRSTISKHGDAWTIELRRRGHLFVRRS